MTIFDNELIWFCVLGGVVSVDTEAAWQTMLSQPLIGCTLAGFIFGNVALGLSVGILLQLPYLMEVPVGGCEVTFSSLGALIGAGVALRLHEQFPEKQQVVLFAGLLTGIIFSWLLGKLWRLSLDVNFYFVRAARTAIDDYRFNMLSFLQGAGVIKSFLFGAGLVLVLSIGLETVLRPVIHSLSVGVDGSLWLLRPVMIGAGLATLIRIFVKKKTLPFAVAGAGLATLALIVRTVT